ncbi:glycerophosphodiester phosphodiesterase family protein [Abyssibius alkaniclasticus]|uniref:glycerophosphodiester phosphodiesterase family protein n=1 Tax=Abyssibius alkaniclasticus TaxID=2881234 RepID=UPI0040590D95
MPDLPAPFLVRPIAHRGLHGGAVPENSRAAFEAAIDGGYGIELDLQLSSDGQAMVFHDYDLARLTGQSGPIQMRSAAELAELTLGNGEGVPTFAEVLALVAGRVPLLVEIKDQDGTLGPDIGALEAACAAELASYAGPVAVMSFNPHAIYEMARIAPDIARGLVTCAFADEEWALTPAARRAALAEIPDFGATGSSFISHDREDLDREAVTLLRAAGVPILCWTVRGPLQEKQARRVAHNITFEGYLA